MIRRTLAAAALFLSLALAACGSARRRKLTAAL